MCVCFWCLCCWKSSCRDLLLGQRISLPSTWVSHGVGAGGAQIWPAIRPTRAAWLDNHIFSCGPVPHISTVPVGLKSTRQGRITRDPSLQIDHHQWGHRGLHVADKRSRPAAGCLCHKLHYKCEPRPLWSECCEGMCFLIRLTSFCFPFLYSLESNKDRMMEGKDQACFKVQLHSIISYLLLNPSPLVCFQSCPGV